MAYRDDISALGANHHWDFDGDSLDQIGSVNGTNTSILFTSAAIAENATNCAETNALTDRVSIPTTSDINDSAQDRKAVCGWFAATAINAPPTRIYGEGNNSLCFHIVMALGNNLMFEVVDGSTDVQVYSDFALADNRSYHFCMVFEGSGFANELRCYIDGVEQLSAEPSNRAVGIGTLSARGVAIFGDPSGTVGVGGDVVLLQAPRNGKYNHWATFSGASAVLSDTEIREELFEKGALPGVTIASGIESAMQTSLDAHANTLRGNEPLNIRVDTVTGDGDLTLVADDITHDSRASIHVQYMGSGTLTWQNTNGSNASIGSTPNGGAIRFVETVNNTVTVLDVSDGLPVDNARVLIEADAGGALTAGADILAGITNASGVLTGTFGYEADQPYTGRVRKSTSAPYYVSADLTGVITSSGLDITVLIVRD